jgi:hypothetical protein
VNGYDPIPPDCSHGIGDECKDWGGPTQPAAPTPVTAAQLARRARHPVAWMKTQAPA